MKHPLTGKEMTPTPLLGKPLDIPPEQDPRAVLAEFAKVGVDVDSLAAQLQDEGAKSFVKSWSELMEVISSKGAALKEARAS